MNNRLPQDFMTIQNDILQVHGLCCIDVQAEAESQEYGALSFQINGLSVRFRTAKITPTKVGQFVTLWKRIGNGPIMPFDIADHIDFFMVTVRQANDFGLFLFPKTVLLAKDIISQNGKGGKRAIRVYPSWDITESKQARTTQAWQLRYFLHIQQNGLFDKVLLQKLLDF